MLLGLRRGASRHQRRSTCAAPFSRSKREHRTKQLEAGNDNAAAEPALGLAPGRSRRRIHVERARTGQERCQVRRDVATLRRAAHRPRPCRPCRDGRSNVAAQQALGHPNQTLPPILHPPSQPTTQPAAVHLLDALPRPAATRMPAPVAQPSPHAARPAMRFGRPLPARQPPKTPQQQARPATGPDRKPPQPRRPHEPRGSAKPAAAATRLRQRTIAAFLAAAAKPAPGAAAGPVPPQQGQASATPQRPQAGTKHPAPQAVDCEATEGAAPPATAVRTRHRARGCALAAGPHACRRGGPSRAGPGRLYA